MRVVSVVLSIVALCVVSSLADCNPPCGPGMCCSKWGFCGSGEAYCGGTPPPPPPPPPPTPTGAATTGGSGTTGGNCNPPCGPGNCCSQWGYCGSGPAYCGGGGTTGPAPTTGVLPTTGSTSGPTNPPNPPTPTGGGDVPNISGAKYVIYIDAALSWSNMGLALNVPGLAPSKNRYNIIALAFWLSSGPADMAYAWQALDDATKTQYLAAYHGAGMRVIASSFGATEFPTTANADPVATATKFSQYVIANRLDGADIDYEDTDGFTTGKGADWLIKFQRALRAALPSPRYIISHAPQGPYFSPGLYPDNAYLKVHQEVGDGIDFYNVQFYNQGSTDYASCDTLLNTANGWSKKTALFEVVASGVPANKIVIGKPVTQADAYNTGFMSASAIAECGKQAKSKGWNGGFMGWQFSHDQDGSWINTIAACLD